jgi:uncharacterized membrane protein YgaE (UPF0421/DUF939 family)
VAASPIAQTTAAAVLAWELALAVLPERRPSFAPLTAIIALGATAGHRGTRAVQVGVGVAVGLGTANIAVDALGAGAWQLGLVTMLALLVAVFVSTDPTLVVQAGVSGVLVVAASDPGTVFPYRFLEALVGGAVALAFSQILFPVDAASGLRALAGGVLELVADGLRVGAAAIRDDDSDRLADAHRSLRDAAAGLASVDDALEAARRAVRVTRQSAGRRKHLHRHLEVPAHLESIVSDASALLRAARRAMPTTADIERMTEAIARLGASAARVAQALGEHSTPALAGDIRTERSGASPPDEAGAALQAVFDLQASADDRLRRLASEISRDPGAPG